MFKNLIFLFSMFSFAAGANTLVSRDTGATLSANCVERDGEECKYYEVTLKNSGTKSKKIDTENDTYGGGKVRSFEWAYTDQESALILVDKTFTAYSIPSFIIGDSGHPVSILLGIIAAPVGLVVDLVKLPVNTHKLIKDELSVKAVHFLFKDEGKSKSIPTKRFERISKKFHFDY